MLDLAIDSSVFVENKLDAAIQELDLLFVTEPTELIGNPHFGCNFEQFLWSQTPMTESLKSYIDSKIQDTLYLKELDYDLNVSFVESNGENVYLVQLAIYYNGQQAKTKTYKIK